MSDLFGTKNIFVEWCATHARSPADWIDMTSALRPPGRAALVGETRIAAEWASMRLAMPWLRVVSPRGGNEPVLVAPGFTSDDGWTESLRRFLDDLGWEVRGWGLGRNHGRVPELIPALIEQTEAFCAETDCRVRLVGWSLGGYLVREVARERPDLVDRVLTLGAPVIGGPKYTASAPMYCRRGYDLNEIENNVAVRETVPIRVPIDSIYSRSDGIVDWRACIDHHNPDVRHHEVFSSHLGLVASPVVFRLVAERLAAATGS
jgi:pimeloyl-ACP methyl ester carboxylesterase